MASAWPVWKGSPVKAVAIVLVTMGVSLAGYELSAAIPNAGLHESVARLCGAVYFASVGFSAFVVYAIGSFGGKSVLRCTLEAATPPFVWMTKECLRLYASHPLAECFYYYLNPLNVGLALLVVLEIAAATVLVRTLRRRRGEQIHVLTAGALATGAASLAGLVGLFTWGHGENAYVLFLTGYRLLFGTGV